MAKKPDDKKSKMGRPLLDIDWDQAEEMAKIHCTALEMASILGIHEDTLRLRCKSDHNMTFSEWYKRFESEGKKSLRRYMWDAAKGGNVTMQIWLSKQALGMRDRIDEVSDQKPVIIKTKDGIIVKLGTTKTDLKDEEKRDADKLNTK
jgi:hypothetical protein